MQRRRFLKAAAATPLIILIPWASFAQLARPGGTFRRVRPSDPAWPGAASWDELNHPVDGNLIKVAPLLAPCSTWLPGRTCLDVLQNARNPFYLGDQPAGTQVSGWLDAWTPEPSAFAVRARSTAHVVAAVNFARQNNLRLVVKGGGHSYQGTSNAPDSLLVWTRAMNAVTLHDAFVPQGCEAQQPPVPAVTIEAGAMWIDAYHAVTTNAGRYVQGGGCTTVGVAGLVQSGGFGSMSKRFGTAAASLLEAEIVTADGVARTVNACREPDLFWALKGGGGGSWGIVTRLTLRTHDLPERFGYAYGKIKAPSHAGFKRLLARFFAFYRDSLLNPHWGEMVKVTPANTIEITMVCQGLDERQITDTWQPFFDWVKRSVDYVTYDLAAHSEPARFWWDAETRRRAGTNFMIADPRPDAPAFHAAWAVNTEEASGFLHGYESLWLPAPLLQEAALMRLTDALFAASRHWEVQLHLHKGLAGAPAEAIAAARDTAMNPAVLDAFALAIIANGGLPLQALPFYSGYARNRARAVDEATAQLRKIVDEPASYVAEANYFNPSWQAAFWGENYSRLREIKKKYDPEGLFFVHHGVGIEGWSDDGFTRLARR